MTIPPQDAAPPAAERRLFVYNAGFLTQRRLRRILHLAGWRLRLGRPGPEDWVGVWGRSPTAARGAAVAARTGAGLVRVEDAFLRSVLPGRMGEPPLGLLIDRRGVHFDPAQPSDLEHLLATHPLDDTALLDRARDAVARLRHWHLSKYNAFDPAVAAPDPGYVLVIDQTRNDAALPPRAARLFDEMLAVAQIEHPGARILIRRHPETVAGLRPGHYGPGHEDARTVLHDAPVSPWHLLEGAVAVYTVSSQLGFEAILAGHRPRIFGQPFYGGWGLTQDENPVPRRARRLTRAQLSAAALILAPTWYDPYRDRLCGIERAIDTLEARARAWRADRQGYVAGGMSLWKRPHLRRFFGRHGPLRFADPAPRASARAARLALPLLVWAGRETTAHSAARVLRVEDGFLRSRGLGAGLVPPLSLVADATGIYYDPLRPSDLENLIAAAPALPGAEIRRAETLVATLRRSGLSKYNTGGPPPALPEGHRILVPGQVEDDASILRGCPGIRTNGGLLRHVRAARPEAVIVYKPHPDVEAGLRPGAVDAATLALADAVAADTDPARLLDAVDEVWTMTSLLGFEALLRRLPVTCLGQPFYAGWGLTHDLAAAPDRRRARPDLAALAHAALIGYPRYLDPVTGDPCPAEIAVARLAGGRGGPGGPGLRVLAVAQGLLAGRAHLWRRRHRL